MEPPEFTVCSSFPPNYRKLSEGTSMQQAGFTKASASPQQPSSPPISAWFPEEVAWSFLETLGHLSLRCVGITDHLGIIRFTNPGCRLIYGWEPQEMVGHHFREFYDDAAETEKMLLEARSKGRGG